jgi:endonuclease III
MPGTSSAATKAKVLRVRRVCRILEKTYGSPRHGNPEEPLSDLAFILISQKTGSWSYEPVYRRLRERWSTWDEVRDAPTHEVAGVLKPAGLSNNRAARLKAILKKITYDFGLPTLEPLKDLSDSDAELYLRSLPGVGEKTAKCVLMYGLGRSVIPVDTHVKRVAQRLGLVPVRATDWAAHRALERLIPAKLRYSFHVNAVAHGREKCRKERPQCPTCPLLRLCPSGGQWSRSLR